MKTNKPTKLTQPQVRALASVIQQQVSAIKKERSDAQLKKFKESSSWAKFQKLKDKARNAYKEVQAEFAYQAELLIQGSDLVISSYRHDFDASVRPLEQQKPYASDIENEINIASITVDGFDSEAFIKSMVDKFTK
jgi:antirestriction protein